MNHVGFAYELPQNAKPKRRETQTSEQERKHQKDVVPLVKQDIVMRTPTRLTTATSDLRPESRKLVKITFQKFR